MVRGRLPTDLYLQARGAADQRHTERALDLIDQAYKVSPSDGDVRELYTALHVAQGIRLGAAAREARRLDIIRRDIGYEEPFEDSAEVTRAFEEAHRAIERALAAEPRHEKGLMMKAAILFRWDRDRHRAEAVGILESLNAGNEGNRQFASALRRLARTCDRCSDTGFCSRCGGRGVRRRLRIETKCETCHGQGICLTCGIL